MVEKIIEETENYETGVYDFSYLLIRLDIPWFLLRFYT